MRLFRPSHLINVPAQAGVERTCTRIGTAESPLSRPGSVWQPKGWTRPRLARLHVSDRSEKLPRTGPESKRPGPR